jgi:type IV pilus assembly protein PilM
MRWLASPPAEAAVEIAPGRVSAATLAGRDAVEAYALEPLPAGAVAPSLASQNIVDPAAVSEAVRAVLGRVGRPARVALVVPDPVVKVSLLQFEQVPSRLDDLDQLLRWQVRKSAPFPVDDATVTYTAGARQASGTEFVVALARRDVIEEYERACADAGAYAGLVDSATFSVINLFLASPGTPSGDWLLVHVRPEYTSIAIMRGEHMIFFRNKPEGDSDTLADLVHQTAMYYQDRLSGHGFGRVLLGGSGRAGGAVELARRSLEERLHVAVEAIDPTRQTPLPDRIGVTPELMDALAPLSGMLLRTRREGVVA